MDYIREVENIEELEALKIKCLKCKIILMEKQGKQPLSSLATFTGRQKKRFLQELNEMMTTLTDDEINREFNDIVCDTMFSSNQDISLYPVLNKGEPDHSILYNPDPLKEPESEPLKEQEVI